ncbi:MAG: flavoprotein [Synergistaceae bacterium]|nr:flavoprotein [Synergistaceae bacterium]
MREETIAGMSEDALVAEIVRRVEEKLISVQKKALVVYTGSLIGFVPSLVSLQQLRQAGFAFDLFLSKSARKLLDVDTLRKALEPERFYQEETLEIAPELLAAPYYTLLVPAMTVNTAAKIAACMADTPASRIISNSMMRGKNVVIARDGCCPENAERIAKGYRMTPALKAKLTANLEALRDFGAVIAGCNTLAYKTVKLIQPDLHSSEGADAAALKKVRCAKKVIGRKEIISLPAGAALTVSKDALITQLARDAASQRGVSIEKEV